MATRRKRKRMKITDLSNRIATGLAFYGVTIPTKKRATRKQLKEIRKTYNAIRKQEKAKGISLPTIAQAAKYIKEQEQQKITPPPTRGEDIEDIGYSDESTPASNPPQYYIDEFKAMLDDAEAEMKMMYGLRPSIIDRFIREAARTRVLIETLINQIGVETFGNYLATSIDYDKLKNVKYYNYDDVCSELEDINLNLLALSMESTEQNPPDDNEPTDFMPMLDEYL